MLFKEVKQTRSEKKRKVVIMTVILSEYHRSCCPSRMEEERNFLFCLQFWKSHDHFRGLQRSEGRARKWPSSKQKHPNRSLNNSTFQFIAILVLMIIAKRFVSLSNVKPGKCFKHRQFSPLWAPLFWSLADFHTFVLSFVKFFNRESYFYRSKSKSIFFIVLFFLLRSR